jgi:hypothetical protein
MCGWGNLCNRATLYGLRDCAIARNASGLVWWWYPVGIYSAVLILTVPEQSEQSRSGNVEPLGVDGMLRFASAVSVPRTECGSFACISFLSAW